MKAAALKDFSPCGESYTVCWRCKQSLPALKDNATIEDNRKFNY
jgi:hypothetical protein